MDLGKMIVKEVKAKGILSKSKINDYALNAYIGCEHACTYCYARFMKRYTGHPEAWGDFVDAKINAPDLLAKEVKTKKPGTVWISGVCDAYQPLEEKYQLTRKCLEILVENHWPIVVQTKSPLVCRDIDILKKSGDCEVGFSIATADEAIRKVFEPRAPLIRKRVEALVALRREGITTFVMIAPMLPGVEGLPELLKGHVTSVLVDRMNYHYADWVYKKQGLQKAMQREFYRLKSEELKIQFEQAGIPCRIL